MDVILLGVVLTINGEYNETIEQWGLAALKAPWVWADLGGLRRSIRREFH